MIIHIYSLFYPSKNTQSRLSSGTFKLFVLTWFCELSKGNLIVSFLFENLKFIIFIFQEFVVYFDQPPHPKAVQNLLFPCFCKILMQKWGKDMAFWARGCIINDLDKNDEEIMCPDCFIQVYLLCVRISKKVCRFCCSSSFWRPFLLFLHQKL